MEDKGLTKVDLLYYLKQLIGVIVLEALGFLVLYFFGPSLIPFIGAGLCFTLSQVSENITEMLSLSLCLTDYHAILLL